MNTRKLNLSMKTALAVCLLSATAVMATVKVRFVNQTTGPIGIFWVNPQKQAIRYGTVQPQKSVTLQTYQGHRWVAKNQQQQILKVYVAPGRDSEVKVHAAAKPAHPPMPVIKPATIRMTVRNMSGQPLDLYWVDHSKRPRRMAQVRANSQQQLTTYAGHRWYLVDPTKRRAVKQFVATAANPMIVYSQKQTPPKQNPHQHQPKQENHAPAGNDRPAPKNKPVAERRQQPTNVPQVATRAPEPFRSLLQQLHREGQRSGSINLRRINPIFSEITLHRPQFDLNGNLTGKMRVGRHEAAVLLQRMSRGYALAIRMPGGRLSDVFNMSNDVRAAIDQFRINAPTVIFSTNGGEVKAGDMTDLVKSFYHPIYRRNDFTVRIQRGVNLVTSASVNPNSYADQALRKLKVNMRQIEIEGVLLKDFTASSLREAKANGKLLTTLRRGLMLTARLPAFKLNWLPKRCVTGNAMLTLSGTPSLSLGFELTMPNKRGPSTRYAAKLRLSYNKLQGGEIAIVATTDQPVPGGLGIDDINLEKATLVLGADTNQNLTVGIGGRIRLGSKYFDVAGKGRINIYTGVPTDIIFRAGSDQYPIELSSRDLSIVVNKLAKAANPRSHHIPIDKVPEFSIRNFVFSYAPRGGDEDLEIEDGIALRGRLRVFGRDLGNVDGKVNTGSDIPSVKLKSRLNNIDLKGLTVRNAMTDIEVSESRQQFVVRGSVNVLGFAQAVNVHVSKRGLYFDMYRRLGGVFATHFRCSAGYRGQWSFQANVSSGMNKVREFTKLFTLDSLRFSGQLTSFTPRVDLQAKVHIGGKAKSLRTKISMGRINPRGIAELFANEAKRVLNDLAKKAENAGKKVVKKAESTGKKALKGAEKAGKKVLGVFGIRL